MQTKVCRRGLHQYEPNKYNRCLKCHKTSRKQYEDRGRAARFLEGSRRFAKEKGYVACTA